MKEPEGKNGWRIRNVSAYCPKVFSAIRLPDAVLSRRTIVLTLVRSADPERANHDIEEDHYWLHDRSRLVDDLWIFGLHYLLAARRAYGSTESAELTSPGFEPWRPLLATATVLEDAGVSDLVQRIRMVATAYQEEKAEFDESPDATRLAVIAIADIADVRTSPTSWDKKDKSTQASPWLAEHVRFTAADVTQRMNALAEDEGLVEDGESYANAKKVGFILKRLRIEAELEAGKKRSRQRVIRRNDALKLYRAYTSTNEPDDDPSDKIATEDTPCVNLSDMSELVHLSGAVNASKNGHHDPSFSQLWRLLPNAAARAAGMHPGCQEEYESLWTSEKGAANG
jgi:hypothetical protein